MSQSNKCRRGIEQTPEQTCSVCGAEDFQGCGWGDADPTPTQAKIAESPARAVLRKLEWSIWTPGGEMCPWCRAYKFSRSHSPTCGLAAALRDPEPAESRGAVPSPADAYAHRVTIPYTNWRGEFGMREIAPLRLFHGSNEWHREPQWLIEAWDIAKGEIRTFALAGIGYPKPPVTPDAAGDLRAAVLEEVVSIIDALETGDKDRIGLYSAGFGTILKRKLRARLAPSGSATPPDRGMGDAVRDVLAERRRQVEAEGWTAEHDDEHVAGELALAAAAYAEGAVWDEPPRAQSHLWPWSLNWWKPTDARRMLVKSGALILAEIERLDRAALTSAPPDPATNAAGQAGENGR